MPRPPLRLAAVVILVLATAACAPTKRTPPPTTAAKTTGKAAATPPAKGAPPAPAVSKPLSVVMGAPLPSTGQGAAKAPAPPAPSGPADAAGSPTGAAPTAAAPAAAADASDAAGQPAPSGLGDGVAAPGTAPTGFGGLAWGASAKSRPGLAVYETDAAASVTTCLWPRGPKDVAGAPIREAFYEFFQDRFYHVWLEFDGMAAYKTALAGLTRTYGPPTQENLEKFYHAWTLGEVNIYCAFHPGENGGDVSFFYQPLYEKMMAARKAVPAKKPQGKAKP